MTTNFSLIRDEQLIEEAKVCFTDAVSELISRYEARSKELTQSKVEVEMLKQDSDIEAYEAFVELTRLRQENEKLAKSQDALRSITNGEDKRRCDEIRFLRQSLAEADEAIRKRWICYGYEGQSNQCAFCGCQVNKKHPKPSNCIVLKSQGRKKGE